MLGMCPIYPIHWIDMTTGLRLGPMETTTTKTTTTQAMTKLGAAGPQVFPLALGCMGMGAGSFYAGVERGVDGGDPLRLVAAAVEAARPHPHAAERQREYLGAGGPELRRCLARRGRRRGRGRCRGRFHAPNLGPIVT